MRCRSWRCAALALLTLARSVGGQVITDGSLGGTATPVPPVNGRISIPAAFGHQPTVPDPQAPGGARPGPNLFHSFSQFDIQDSQIATFYGPQETHNVIARVTGGDPSAIDGIVALAPEIAGANLFLLNPSGFVFGPKARLDLKGSFAASTSDYLELQDGARFSARTLTGPEGLTISPPASFGFLGDRPGKIDVQTASLAVAPGKDIHLIAGEVDIHDGARVSAPGGQVVLAAPRTLSSFPLQGPPPAASPDDGPISVRAGDSGVPSLVDATAPNDSGLAGRLLIRGGRLTVKSSSLRNDTTASDATAGATTDIEVGDSVELTGNGGRSTETGRVLGTLNVESNQPRGPGSRLHIEARQTIQLKATSLLANTRGNGDASDLDLHAPRIVLEDSTLSAQVLTRGSTGQGPKVAIVAGEQILVSSGSLINVDTRAAESITPPSLAMTAPTIELGREGGADSLLEIAAGTSGQAPGGNIVLQGDDLRLSNQAHVQVDTGGTGGAGTIHVMANRVTLADHAQIRAIADAGTTGPAGVILVEGKTPGTPAEEVLIRHSAPSPTPDAPEAQPVGLLAYSESATPNAQRGSIDVRAQVVTLSGGTIRSTTRASSGGRISLEAQQFTAADGSRITASTFGPGAGGEISVTADLVTLRDRAQLSTSSDGAGGGGSIDIQARRFELQTDGGLTSYSSGANLALGEAAGRAGNIQVTARESLSIDHAWSDPTTTHPEAPPSAGIAVSAPASEAGTITLCSGGSLDVSYSTITASGLTGGNIDMAALGGIQILRSSLTASSKGDAEGGNILIPGPGLPGSDPCPPGSLPTTVVLNASDLIAHAEKGKGGQVQIQTPGYLKSSDTHIDVSSTLGARGLETAPPFTLVTPTDPPDLQMNYSAPAEWTPLEDWASQDPEGYTPLRSPRHDGMTDRRRLWIDRDRLR